MLGLKEKENTVYIVNYGLVKVYINYTTGKHIPFREKKKLITAPCFASINAHMGYEQSRRDDLESLGYTLIYLAKGNLPWQNIQAPTEKELKKRVSKEKSLWPLDKLCSGLVEPFNEYMRYCRTLLLQDKPDYNYLKGLFKSYFLKHNLDKDFVFYWNAPADVLSPKGKVEKKEEEKEMLEENAINGPEGKTTEEENESEVADEINQKCNFEILDISEQGKL